ncbi:MAG: rane-associated protein [Nocardioidaceae bacterium]|nr:rane-associated protein [Nocardioidaceae bacterium]
MTTTLVALMGTLGPLAIVVLMAVAFAETGILAGFLVPGDTLVFSAGVLLATGVLHLPVWLTILAVAVAAMAGDQVAYALGRRCGPRVLNRPRSRFFSPRHAEHAQALFKRHGPVAVVLARFVPLVRTLTPVVAGVGRMPRAQFARFNAAGAVAWVTLTLGGGYLFGGVSWVTAHVGLIAMALAALSLLPVVTTLLRVHREAAAPAALPVPACESIAEREPALV